MVEFNTKTRLTTRALGQSMEDKACLYLEKQGLTLLQRNFFCSFGEIDLIMQDNDELVFIEVRHRNSDAYGDGIESINHYKQKKLIRSAQVYLNKNKHSDNVNCRFDVLATSKKQEIDWIKAAFELES